MEAMTQLPIINAATEEDFIFSFARASGLSVEEVRFQVENLKNSFRPLPKIDCKSLTLLPTTVKNCTYKIQTGREKRRERRKANRK